MREMKDSGVEWIGEIPQDWNVCKIKRIAEGLTDGTHGTYERTSEGCLLLSAKNVFEDGLHIGENESLISEEDYKSIISNGFPRENDVLLCCVGTIGRCTVYKEKEPIAFQRSVIFIRCNNRMLPSFLNYNLQSPSTLIQEKLSVNKSAQEGIYQRAVKELQIVLPEIKQQKWIIDYLDSKCSKIDESIEAHQAIIEKLKEYKLSVITEAVTKGINPNVEMKESGIEWIGKIPIKWNVGKTLYALSMPITDGPHETPELFDKGIPFVSAEAVSCGNGVIDFEHIRGYISQEFYEECCKKYVPQINDIYMIKSGATTGKVAIVDTDRKFAIWSPLAVFRCNPNKMNYMYLLYFLQSDVYQKQVQDKWTYGTQQNIGMRSLEKLFVCFPSLDEQRNIADYLNEQCIRIEKNINERKLIIQKLKEYKKSLIYEVVTGKKEV